MPVRKIASFLRARNEKKKNDVERQSGALEVFLRRLEHAFPDHALPMGKVRQDELALIARERNLRRSESNREFLDRLKRSGVDAYHFSLVATEAADNPSAFARRWVGELTRSGQTRLSEIRPVDTFPTILAVIRDLHAKDLAEDIFVRDVARVIVERVLTKPAKRA